MKFHNALSYIISAKDHTTNLYDAICFAGAARLLLSSAEPQNEVRPWLYESIQIYQSLFSQAILKETPMSLVGYRHHLNTCPPFLDSEYMNEVAEMEPILPSGRNFDYREFGWLISFNPYRPLASFESVRNRSYRKKTIVDVGANGFTASPKQLVDNYAALGMHFDELIMFEPDIDGMEKIPDIYRQTMNITFYKQYVELFTRNVKNDLISWLNTNV